MSSGPADDDDCHTVQFQLRVDGIDPRVGRNRTWLATHDDDFGFCVHNFARAEGVAFETCAFCRLADTPHFGGADWRFGLYCFRDAPEEQERLRREPSDEVWNSVAWSHVDAFHTCPSFEMAPHWLEPRKPEATAAPGPDPTEKS